MRVVIALFLFTFSAQAQEASLYDLIMKAKKPVVSIQKTTKLNFNAYHPQGMMKVGGFMYMTAVEVIKSPEKAKKLDEYTPYDRSPGEGKAHFLQFDADGNLTMSVALGENTIYHPGGFGFDGTHFWVPVAEYRPNSKSIIYKIKIEGDKLNVEKAFEVADHIGGVTIEPGKKILQGMNWGSRKFFEWTTTGREMRMKENPSFYIDYQDCKAMQNNTMLCTGIGKYDLPEQKVVLGGIDLINLFDFRPLRQLPIVAEVPTDKAKSFTQNPTYFEAIEGKIYMYSVPEDGKNANLYVLEIK